MADNLDRATPRICDYCGEPLGNSVHWIGGEPGVFHDGCLAKRMYLRAPAAEIDRLRAENERMRAALNALHEIVTNGRWLASLPREWCVSEEVYDLAYNADLFARHAKKD